MAVSERDVRHVADLARLGLDPARIDALAAELNGILAHMDVLAAVDTADARTGADGGDAGERRADQGPQLPLERTREVFAPEMRDGFFLVPRLASHDGEGERRA